jgi:SAM-dependent methyltransferase
MMPIGSNVNFAAEHAIGLCCSGQSRRPPVPKPQSIVIKPCVTWDVLAAEQSVGYSWRQRRRCRKRVKVRRTADKSSAMSSTFEPNRFRSTVPFYAAYRVPYPEALISLVAERCNLARATPVLDLGCGPGQLAVAFARLGCAVTAMDPEPDMLAAAAKQAAACGLAINLVEGSSYDLSVHCGPFQIVAMGRSFHWMDRAATLGVLDQIIALNGAVVLFGDRRIATPGTDWPSLLHELSRDFATVAMAKRRWDDPAWEPHEVILLRSAFPHLTLHGMTVARRLSADDIVGLTFSRSNTSPAALGEGRQAFEARLRAGLTRLAPDGFFNEIVEIRALIARRRPGW